MTNEGKILKNTLIAVLAYLITYTLSAGILLSIMIGASLFDAIPLMFVAFPMMFTGNLLPSALGYGAICLCSKVRKNDPIIDSRARFFALLVVTGIETLGAIVYYSNVGEFASASFPIIALLIIDTVRTNKKYKTLKNAPEVQDTSDVVDTESSDDTAIK